MKTNPLWGEGDSVLIAVSGGADSSVLARLMVDGGVSCAIAHCNFHLRGEESDRDEIFTRNMAAELGIEIFVKHMNTYEYSFKEGISVEMAARDLRYQWFKELLKDKHFQWVATGHHADDQIETMIMNLIRGSGISGLRGMLPKTDKVIRPLLPFFRHEIEEYALANKIEWVDDSTNKSTDIRRNFIRHKILPLFENINPNYKNTILRSISDIQEAEEVYQKKISDELEALTAVKTGSIEVSVDGLLKLNPVSVYLFELLSKYGFNRYVIDDITKSLKGESGKQFFSPEYRVVKDRKNLIITSKEQYEDDSEWEYFINNDDKLIKKPVAIECLVSDAKGYRISHDKGVASLDFDKLNFPLTLRKWRQGDKFVPFGMRSSKKLSDFFVNLKLSIPDKEKIYVVASGNHIVWVVGLRIDNRYRITSKTSKIFTLKIVVEEANKSNDI